MDAFLDALHAFLIADASLDADSARLVQFATHCAQICCNGVVDVQSMHDFVARTHEKARFKIIRGTLRVKIAHRDSDVADIRVLLKDKAWCGCPIDGPFARISLVLFEIDKSTCEIRKHVRSLGPAPTLSRALLDACIQYAYVDYRQFKNAPMRQYWPSADGRKALVLRYDASRACFLLNSKALETRYAPIDDVFCAFFEKECPNRSDLFAVVQTLIDHNPQLMTSLERFLDTWREGASGTIRVSPVNRLQVSYSRATDEPTCVPLLLEIANGAGNGTDEPYELLFRARISISLHTVRVMNRAAAASQRVAAAFRRDRLPPLADVVRALATMRFE